MSDQPRIVHIDVTKLIAPQPDFMKRGFGRYWLSFADSALPKGSQFLGAIIAPYGDFIAAVAWTHREKINPGGEVQGVEIPGHFVIPESFCGRLLSREECAELDGMMMEQDT